MLWWILTALQPEEYVFKILSLLAGCLIIAAGAYFEVAADVTMLPADGFSRAIVRVTGKESGTVKLITDLSQAFIALVPGLIFLRKSAGVREGTVIAALLIGNVIKVIGRHWKLERIFE